MRLRRCTRGLAFLLVLLVAWAFVLDDLPVLFAAALLLCGLLWSYLHFDAKFRALAASVSVSRSLDRSQVRRGSTVQVTTVVTINVPPGMQAAVRERLSPAFSLQDGSTAVTADPSEVPVVQKMIYRITPVVHGEYAFPGFVLSARDYFFEREFVLSAPRFCGPVLVVQPVGIFEAGTRRITAETREIEKMSVLSGFGIRALREYYAGDDMRKIDWKQTAKHDKLFVREYAGVMTLPPLIVIDLPWRGDTLPEREFGRMVAAVSGLAEYSIRTYQYVSVLIISGANVLAFIAEEKDLERCMTTLRRWMHPVERATHLYHLPDRADLRMKIRAIDGLLPEEAGAADPDSRFLSLLRKRYRESLQEQHPLTFTGQVMRTIGQLAVDEMYVFSLARGDTGHLRQISRQAQAMRILVHLRVPDPFGNGLPGSRGSRFWADTVEAFA